MDAFIVSEYVKKSLQSRKKGIEHAAFIINSPSASLRGSEAPAFPSVKPPVNNNFKMTDLSNKTKMTDNSDNSRITDNSNNSRITDNSNNTRVTDNSRIEETTKVAENTDNSATAYSTTDNSSNLTVNNIKVTNVKGGEVQRYVEDNEDEDEDDEEYVVNSKANKISSITFLLMLLINSYAAYLSWECNSGKNYPLAMKIVFSSFAFIFGTMYLLYYVLFRFDECNKF
jgi:hypothetical protein